MASVRRSATLTRSWTPTKLRSDVHQDLMRSSVASSASVNRVLVREAPSRTPTKLRSHDHHSAGAFPDTHQIEVARLPI